MAKAKWIALIFISFFLAPSLAVLGNPTNQATVSGDEWPMFLHDPAHTGSTSGDLVEAKQLWSFFDGETGNYNYGPGPGLPSPSPVAASGIVYISSNVGKEGHPGGNIYALNAYTGKEIWNYYDESGIGTNLAVYGNLLFVSYSNGLLALNNLTGKKVYNFTIDGDFLTVANGIIYVGTTNSVRALNATIGAKIWTFPTPQQINCLPAVANGMIYIGSLSNFFSLNALTGEQVWSYPRFFGDGSSPSVSDGMVYIGDSNGNVYAFNALTGEKIWTFMTYILSESGGIQASPIVSNGVVYIGSEGGGLYALNATTGSQIWNERQGTMVRSSAAVSGGVVYLGSSDSGEVFAFNATTGTIIWNFPTNTKSAVFPTQYSPAFKSSPAIVNGVLYISSEDGNLYAIGQPAQPLPRQTPFSQPYPVQELWTLLAVSATAIAVVIGIILIYHKVRYPKFVQARL